MHNALSQEVAQFPIIVQSFPQHAWKVPPEKKKRKKFEKEKSFLKNRDPLLVSQRRHARYF